MKYTTKCTKLQNYVTPIIFKKIIGEAYPEPPEETRCMQWCSRKFSLVGTLAYRAIGVYFAHVTYFGRVE